ncbi:MAG: FlgN protein [Candidatus Accumulibacter sp. BA-94]|nr:MAG: FlgN protein [Candidatus Accumulibacter sp. BA-94]
MMATTSSDFLPTVNSEVAALGTFIALLESEQRMLIAGEVDGLLELVGQKNGLAAELAALPRDALVCWPPAVWPATAPECSPGLTPTLAKRVRAPPGRRC